MDLCFRFLPFVARHTPNDTLVLVCQRTRSNYGGYRPKPFTRQITHFTRGIPRIVVQCIRRAISVSCQKRAARNGSRFDRLSESIDDTIVQ